MNKFLFVVFIIIVNLLFCSCSNSQEDISNIPTEAIVELTEEDKELSKRTVEKFMGEICKFDVVNANKYIAGANEVNSNSSVDIDEVKQNMLNTIKGTLLDDYRMYDLIDRIFNQCSYEILNLYEEENRYVYDIQVKMSDLGRFAQDVPNALNDAVLEEVIAECLYKGVITESDLYSKYVPKDKQKAFENVAVDKIIEILNEKVDSYVFNARMKLSLIKVNDAWLIDRDLSDMDDFFAMLN